MTAETAAEELERLKPLCAEVSAQIVAAKGSIENLYANRREIFQRMVDLGMQRKEIAAVAGIEPMSVTYALKPRKGDTPDP